jgi:hypothetical protein
MSRPHRFFAPLWLALAALAASPAAPTDEAENYRQLQAMPRERRIALSENLERFDKLGPAEQASIRKLDAELSRLDPVEQARYRSLLRRYHLWANGLTADQKEQLNAAGSPEARFNLARKFRLKELEAGKTGPRVFGVRTGDCGLVGPYEAAHLLRIWNRLTPVAKVVIEKHQERGRLIAEIRAKAKEVGVANQPFSRSEEDLYSVRLEADEEFKKLVGPLLKQSTKKGAPSPKLPEHQFAEFLYFGDHKPKPISQKNLERFSASCPAWFHAMLDSLSPDDARSYLTILYRLLYPEPTEMPADVKPANPSAAPAAGIPKPAAKKSGPAGTF